MPRNRRDTRGKRIYWKSPNMYALNVGTAFGIARTVVTGTYNGCRSYTYLNRQPLIIQGMQWGSDLDTIPSIFSVIFVKNNIVTNLEASAVFLNSILQRNVPQKTLMPAGEKIILNYGDTYGFTMADSQNRTNEMWFNIFGYYYTDDKIYYESPVLFAWQPVPNFNVDTGLTIQETGKIIIYEDVNPVFITHVVFGRAEQGSDTSTIVGTIFRNGLTVSQSPSFDVTSAVGERVVELTTKFWLKQGDEWEIDLLDSQNRDYEWSVRLIGYRREMKGIYRFSKQDVYFGYNLSNNTMVDTYINPIGSAYSGKWFYPPDPICRVIGANVSRKAGNVVYTEKMTKNQITINSNTNNASGEASVTLTNVDEEYPNPWNFDDFTPYITSNNWYGTQQRQNSGDLPESTSRRISQVSL